MRHWINLAEGSSFNIDNVEVIGNGFGTFKAMYKGRAVGACAVWGGGYPSDPNTMEMSNVAVSAPYRKKGIGRLLYTAADEYVRNKGKTLVPAVSLSNDAFEFWKKFRPEAVSQDGRHWLHLYAGKTIRHPSKDGIEREWTIYHCYKGLKHFGVETVIDGKKVTTLVPGSVVFDQIGDLR